MAFRSQLRASQARSANVPPPICFAPLRSPLRSRSTLGLSRSWSTTWLQSIAAGKTCLRGGLALGRGRSAANQGFPPKAESVAVRNRRVSMMGVYQPRQPPPVATAAPKAQHAAVRNRRVSTRRSAAPTVPDAPSRRGVAAIRRAARSGRAGSKTQPRPIRRARLVV